MLNTNLPTSPLKRLMLFPAVIAILLLMPVIDHAFQQTPPPIPAGFYGTISGEVSEDTVVTAVIQNKTVAETTLIQNGEEWVFSLIVPGDNAATKAVEGGNPGDAVEFTIDGQKAAQTAVWKSGSNTQLDLTVGASIATSATALWLLGGLILVALVSGVVYTQRRTRPATNHLPLQENISW